ncbi:phage portal protein [bacterium]|nr:phage portal protein [bacterium]
MNYLNSDYEAAFRAVDITSAEMKTAIQTWYDLYFQAVSNEETDSCQKIPYTVVRKLTKTVFSEYTSSSKDEFVSGVLDALNKKKEHTLQMALIGGESGLKPVPTNKGFRFSVVSRPNVMVFARDGDGDPTDIGTAEKSVNGRYYYTLLERRTVDAGGYLTIENKLYRSNSSESLGQNVPLTALPQYADFAEKYTFQKPVGSVGIAWLKTPIANCVDGSQGSVSVYAAAVGLIENINRNEAQINGEFERGKSRIIASADMLEFDDSGKRKKLSADVFTAVDEAPDEVGITIFSPAFREQSYLARKTEYLRNVENVIGLKRGLLSEVEAAERTATEVTSSEGDYNLTIIEFQQMWETAIREAVRLCGTLGQMYRVPGAHDVDDDSIVVDWGDGVLFDEEKTWADYKDMVASGLLKPEIALGWKFNMPRDTPAQLKKIREKYMPDAVEDEE